MQQFRAKVRSRRFLIGGSRIAYSGMSAPLMNIRVDAEGEPIDFGLSFLGPKREVFLGTLQPDESFTLPLSNVAGVWAVSATSMDTFVDCSIATEPSGVIPELQDFVDLRMLGERNG